MVDDDKSLREINRFTLLGEYDGTFVALLKSRLHADQVDPKDANQFMVAHIHRGISLLPSRVKTVGDLAELLPPQVSLSNTDVEVTA